VLSCLVGGADRGSDIVQCPESLQGISESSKLASAILITTERSGNNGPGVPNIPPMIPADELRQAADHGR
jgi:hypothetical protein